MRLPLIFLVQFVALFSIYAQLPHCQVNTYNKVVEVSGSRLVEYTEIELQINSAKGTDYAEIEIPYTNGNDIKELEAGIYDLNGKELRRLKNKDVVRSNAFSYQSFHSDDMELSFKLVHNQYPYLIKYSYKKDANEYLYIANWFPRWYKKVPLKKASLTVDCPIDFQVRLYQQGLDSATVETHKDRTVYKWQVEDVPYVKKEKFGPQSIELQTQVLIIPEYFYYGIKGSTKSWGDFGQWGTLLKSASNLLTEAEKEKVNALIANCATDEEKIRVLYKYLQNNTRYINVSLDIGGLKPETAAYVCRNKYGDCKALTNYMQSMLSEVGIHSVYTMVYAGHYPEPIQVAYPSQQFNHVILCVPQANDTIWLECTDNTSPFNYLGAFTQNRKVLLVDGAASRLAHTPALSADDVLNQYVSKVFVHGDGSISLKSKGLLRGPAFDYMRGLNDALPEREKIDYLEELDLFKQADIVAYHLEQAHRDSAVLELEVDATLNGGVESIGSRTLVKPFRPFYLKLDSPEKRTQELRFPFPINVSDSVIYVLPQAIESLSGLKDVEIQSDYGYYKKEVSFSDSTLMVKRQIIVNAGTYQLDEYAEVYTFIKRCSSHELQKGMIKYHQ